MAAEIRLGTSSLMAAGWAGAFYPVRMKQADYLSFYFTRFDTVEVDSTFYAIPTNRNRRELGEEDGGGFCVFPQGSADRYARECANELRLGLREIRQTVSFWAHGCSCKGEPQA
jgi:hypothetical protein